MKPYALLARVSTIQQAKAHGIPEQLRAARLYAARTGLQTGGEYVDQLSGVLESREAFYRLIDEAEQYRGVIVDHIDRVGRDEELSFRFLKQLWAAGLEVHSAARGGVVEHNLQTGLEVIVAAEERRRTREKTQRALIAEAERGLLPNGLHLFGYRNLTGLNAAEIKPDEARVVRRVFALAGQGLSYRAIARAMMDEGELTARGSRVWFQHTVRRLITNPTYKGEYLWRHTTRTYRLAVPAIVDEDTWDRAQRRKRGAPPSLGLPLTGRLRCGLCGRNLSARRVDRAGRKVAFYYRCGSYKEPGGHCGLPLIRRDKLDPAIEAELRRVLSSPAELAAILGRAEALQHEEKTAEEARALEAERGRVIEMARRGLLPLDEAEDAVNEIRARLRLLTSAPTLEYPLAEYAEAARTMPFAELLELADATVIVTADALTLRIGRGIN